MPGWNASNSAGGDPGAVTILDGSFFCVSGTTGDMAAESYHGWFYRDTRAMSSWNLLVGGAPMEHLDVYSPVPNRAVFIGRVPHRVGRESTLIVERDRTVGGMLQEVVTLRNYGPEEDCCTLHLQVDVDFADLFEVKAGREGVCPTIERSVEDDTLIITCSSRQLTRRVAIDCPGATARRDGLVITVTVPAKDTRTVTFTATPSRTPELLDAPDQTRRRDERLRVDRAAWLAGLPTVHAEDELFESVLSRCVNDLSALRIEHPSEPGRVMVAAGAPWFMTLFGRDSLLTSYMTLTIDRTLAVGTLHTLAALQGEHDVPETDEQPGRILHEVRSGQAAVEALGGSRYYYGTADATPLFISLIAETHRFGGLVGDDLEQLLPHADRATKWMTDWGDRDGDGFIEYARGSEHGLINQGWKDSWDGINFADGTIAKGPIALAEVQGYAYRAWRDRAELARAVGDDLGAEEYDERANDLKQAFNRRFWLPDKGWFAVALDGQKRQVDALTSNLGHCLWSGIVDDEKATAVAAHLLSPQMFSGWGVRTLAEGMGAFNPVSYHNGSIWPHDNALVAEGLMRYGFIAEAKQVISAMLEAAIHFGGRLPELFCGFSRDMHPEPIAYPTSCSPQAWASATPLHLLRVLLRFAPDVPERVFHLAPVLPQSLGSVRIEKLPLGGGTLTFSAREQEVLIDSSPPALKWSRVPPAHG